MTASEDTPAAPSATDEAALIHAHLAAVTWIEEHFSTTPPQPCAVQQRMPGLEAEIFPNTHHLAAMARPEAVNARIIEFLKTEPGTARQARREASRFTHLRLPAHSKSM